MIRITFLRLALMSSLIVCINVAEAAMTGLITARQDAGAPTFTLGPPESYLQTPVSLMSGLRAIPVPLTTVLTDELCVTYRDRDGHFAIRDE